MTTLLNISESVELEQNLKNHKLAQEQTFICKKLTESKTFSARDLSQ